MALETRPQPNPELSKNRELDIIQNSLPHLEQTLELLAEKARAKAKDKVNFDLRLAQLFIGSVHRINLLVNHGIIQSKTASKHKNTINNLYNNYAKYLEDEPTILKNKAFAGFGFTTTQLETINKTFEFFIIELKKIIQKLNT